MAISAKFGIVDVTTASGTQSVTGVGFQPEVLLFFNGARDNGWFNDYVSGFGMAVGTGASDQAITLSQSQDSVGTSVAYKGRFNDRCVGQIQQSGSTIFWDAELDSFDPDGFTLNKTTPPTVFDRKIQFLALAGLADADLVEWTGNGATGVQSVASTVAGPRLALTMTANTASTGITSGLMHGMGAVDLSGNQWAWAVSSEHGVGTSQTARVFDTAAGLITLDVSGAIDSEATCSLTSTGMDVNWSNASSSIFYTLFLKSATVDDFIVGTFTQPTTNTTKSVAVSHDPKAVMVFGLTTTTDGSAVAHNHYTLGGSDGTTEGSIVTFDEDAQTTMDAEVATGSGGGFGQIALRGSGINQGVTGAINDVAFDAVDQEIDFPFTGVDGTEYNIAYLAIGDGEDLVKGHLPLMHVGA